MKLPHILFTIITTIWLQSAHSADIQVLNDCAQGYCIEMDGKIARGDYDRILSIIHYKEGLPRVIIIASPGGDVVETIKIGKLIRRGLIRVESTNLCNSACSFIVFAGIDHYKLGKKVGLHRPYYEQEYFADLDFEEANKKYTELDNLVITYLEEMGVPTIISEKIMSIPSNTIEYISLDDYIELAGSKPPAFDEWLIAQCGAMSAQESHDVDLATSYDMYFSSSRGEQLNNSTGGLLREEAMQAKSLSPAYREYLIDKKFEIRTCQRKAITIEQDEFAKLLIKENSDKEFTNPFMKSFGKIADTRAKAKDSAHSKELEENLKRHPAPPK